ncbi:MAG: hypothetical protein ACFFCE_14035 [Promethearchaeota archaeon]
MGNGFGVLSFLLGIIGIGALFLKFVLNLHGHIALIFAVLAIIFGIIGVAVDDSKALGVIGLIIGIVVVIILIAGIPLLRVIRNFIQDIKP